MKILIVDEPTEATSSFKELLESKEREVVIAKNESHLVSLLRLGDVDVVLMEPLQSSSYLSDDLQEPPNVEIGGVGLLILDTISEVSEHLSKKPKIILRSVVTYDNLTKVGLSEHSYLRKGNSSWEDIVRLI